MSDREMAKNILDTIPDSQMIYIVNLLKNWKLSMDEAADDAFCENLYNDYLNDTDPEKNNGITIENFAESLGIKL